MKCPNCGADIQPNSRVCSFCNTPITVDMLKEQEQLQKQGCPRCGSTNITFQRESQGSFKSQNANRIIHQTVGLCKDCGNTWYVPIAGFNNPNNAPQKKSKLWLWILGWIIIFPVPLTILLLRKKDMNPKLKYGLIAAAFIVYFLIGIFGNSGKSDTKDKEKEETKVEESSSKDTSDKKEEKAKTEESKETTESKDDNLVITLDASELGEYGDVMVFNAGTEFEDESHVYRIPSGTYEVKNIGDYPAGVNVYQDTKTVNEDGWEEWVSGDEGSNTVIKVGETAEINIPEGYLIHLDEPAKFELTQL